MAVRSRYRAVLLGSSLGGVEALQVVLGSLRVVLGVPVLVTQHTGPRASALDRLLGRVSTLPVEWAADGVRPAPGRVYLCPPRSVLRLEPDGTLTVEQHQRPSSLGTVDEMFTSAAQALGDEVLAVVLTGSGRDGAAGAQAVKAAGGTVVVQDELTSLAFGMPGAVVAAGTADLVLPLAEIPELLDQVVGRGGRLPLPAVLAAEAVFAAGGEMGALMAATDWSRSPLGPVEKWPAVLRNTLAAVLAAQVPMNVLWGPDMIQLYNDATLRMSGSKHPEMLARPVLVAWAEAAGQIGPPLREVWRTGRGQLIPDLALTVDRDGFLEQVHCTVSYSPLRDGTDVVGILTTLVETTVQVRVNRRLQTLQRLAAATADDPDREGPACERMAAALAENRPDVPFALIYLTDRTGTELHLAAAVGLEPGSAVAPRRLTLYEGGAWPAAGVLRSREPQVIDDLAGRFPAWTVPGETVPTRRAMVLPAGRREDGAVPAVLVVGAGPLVPFDDDYRAFLGLVAETVGAGVLTARRRHHAQDRMAAMAALNRAKDEFFTGVSHEFRTPLALLLLPLEQLLAAELRPDQDDAARLAHRNALRLLKLVDTLLEFARIEQGGARARFADVDLAELTADVASVFRSAIEHAGLEYVVDCPPLGRTVPVDRDMWEQIVLNLVSNALKHTFAGTITVAVALRRNHAELQVSDTGVGIDDAEIPHLFARFHRVRGVRARSHEGSGLGLALVRQLVQLHRGSVRVRSTVGQGTTFTVWLPVTQPRRPDDPVEAKVDGPRTVQRHTYVEEAKLWLAGPPQAPAGVQEAAAPGPALPGRRPVLLLVDDNRDMREYVGRLLADRYEILAAADGREALDMLEGRPVDLVLADVMLPELDGLELLARIRADPRLRRIPVVLLTAVAHPDAAISGLAAGAHDYIVKPFTARELVARIDAQLALADLRGRGAPSDPL